MGRFTRDGLFVVLSSVFLVFLLCGSLWARPGMIKAKTILDYRKELKLTGDQVEKIKAYLFDLDSKMADLRSRLVNVNREIMVLLKEGAKKKGSLDLDKVKQKIREAYGIRAQMAIAEIETAEKINEALTPAQFEKWKKIRSKERMKNRGRIER